MRDFSEIRQLDENKLLYLATQKIKSFPILNSIYDDRFLKKIIRHKNSFDNSLLLLLVKDNPIDALMDNRLFEEIEENLELLQSKDIDIFRTKLTQWRTIDFENAVTELEFIAEYLRKGYQVEIEPSLPNNRKGDFYAIKDSIRIYFELKTIYNEFSMKDQAIMDELSYTYYKMSFPFKISIDLEKNFKRNQTIEVTKYIQRRLKEIYTTSKSLPFTFVYPENNEPIVTVLVQSKLPFGEKCYISGFTFGGGIKGDWSDLRWKIASGVKQLHPDYPGVIIVNHRELGPLKFEIENAIFGDLSIKKFGELQLCRNGDRIFAKNKNNRLSAIIFYEKNIYESGYVKKKFVVYHNPYASKKLSFNVFEGENVTQI